MDFKSQNFKALEEKMRLMRRSKTVVRKSYWEELLPQFPITDHPFKDHPTPFEISKEEIDFCVQQMKSDGYMVTSPIIPLDDLKAIETCIDRVVEKKHNPNYALVYDVFYEFIQKLEQVLTPILGENYQLVADEFGAFFIKNNESSKGSGPHRDTVYAHGKVQKINDLPTIINVWIPLTDATTLNSCMHLIPISQDNFIKDDVPEEMFEKKYSWQEVKDLLHSVRSIPMQAGSIIAWNTNVLHWGGKSSQFATHPRKSIAVYFQNRNVPPYHKFTMNIPSPIPFDYRLYLIEKQEMDRELKNDSFRKYQKIWFDYQNQK